jgi:hypothetical protein
MISYSEYLSMWASAFDEIEGVSVIDCLSDNDMNDDKVGHMLRLHLGDE